MTLQEAIIHSLIDLDKAATPMEIELTISPNKVPATIRDASSYQVRKISYLKNIIISKIATLSFLFDFP